MSYGSSTHFRLAAVVDHANLTTVLKATSQIRDTPGNVIETEDERGFCTTLHQSTYPEGVKPTFDFHLWPGKDNATLNVEWKWSDYYEGNSRAMFEARTTIAEQFEAAVAQLGEATSDIFVLGIADSDDIDQVFGFAHWRLLHLNAATGKFVDRQGNGILIESAS